MAGSQLMKRIPSIKFPQRRPKPSGQVPHQTPSSASSSASSVQQSKFLKSEVPAPPTNTTVGGKASLQPKRTPLSDHEIEAILLGGCF